MNKKLRIFFNTNAMWSTSGYGQQAADLLPKIRDEGYPLAICNFFGSQGGKFEWQGIQQYPIINHVYGSDALIHHAKDFKADVVFTLQDIWVLNPQDLEKVPHFIPITPIDHDPVPLVVLEKLRFAYRVITYSQFGERELRRNGIFSTYIPHTVNTEVFTPMDKKERKKQSGLPEDSFLVGMVGANKDNPPRKSFQEVMDAFVLFLKLEPKALLYIHSNPQFPGGFNFEAYAQFLGIRDKLFFPDVYDANFNIGKKEMANIYNTFDVFVLPSTSEGFGVPIIEAQSCGVPVITSNWTSMAELVKPGETGYLVDMIQKRWTGMGSYMAIPSTQSIYEQMQKVWKADRTKMAKVARKHIVENYDLNTIFTQKWIPYLSRLEAELYPEVANEKPSGV